MIKTVTDLEGDSRAPSPRAEEFWSPFPLPVADMPGRAVPLSSGRPPPPPPPHYFIENFLKILNINN